MGLHIAHAFQHLFPLEYAAGVRDRPATLPHFHLIAGVFLGLVNQRLFPIEDGRGEIYIAEDPMWLLGQPPVADDLEAIADFETAHYFFVQPHPEFHGLGVQSFYSDWTEPELVAWYALPIALWHLFRDTAWSIGYEIADLSEQLPIADRQAIERLQPLPALNHEGVNVLLDGFRLERPYGLLTGDLIRYAFGKTGNELADYTSLEYEDMFDVYESSWSDAMTVARDVHMAMNLSTSFSAWERAVGSDPGLELQLISDHLYRLLDQLGNPPKTLIEIFTAEELFHDNTIDLTPVETPADTYA